MKDYTKKNNQKFVIPSKLSEKSDHFFRNRYDKWEQSSFWIYDYFSDKDKVFIDIGGWNGCTAIYASRLNKFVISLEPDPVSLIDYHAMLDVNKITNITLIEKPIYSSRKIVNFSPLLDKWNTSSSHIKNDKNTFGKKIKSIIFEDIEEKVDKLTGKSIDSKSVSLIKIDIEGNEQYLLKSVKNFDNDIPLYVSFHLDWWNKKSDLLKWESVINSYKHIYATTSYGTEDGDSVFKKLKHGRTLSYIQKNPFTSIVFSQEKLKHVPLVSPLNSFKTILKNKTKH